MPTFEPYHWKLGCVAFEHEGIWYVVRPNGYVTKCKDEEDARLRAQRANLGGKRHSYGSFRNTDCAMESL
jgi:hypothetical protein